MDERDPRSLDGLLTRVLIGSLVVLTWIFIVAVLVGIVQRVVQ